MEDKSIKIAGWLRIVLLLFPYLFIVGFFQLIGMYLAGGSYTDSAANRSSEEHLLTALFGMIGTFLVLWIFMKYIDKERFIRLGFNRKGKLKDFIVGTTAGLVTMILGFVLLLSINEIEFSRVVFNLDKLIFSIGLFLIVALVEEAVFRGYVLKNLMLSMNKYLALFVSSVLFAIMHGANPNIGTFSLFSLFFAGLILGISYIFTKNLWFPIGLHFGWNFFQSLFGFNVSGQDIYSLIEFNYSTGNLLNGGAFGFEGSIFSLGAQIILFLGIFFHYNPLKKREINLLSGAETETGS